MPSARESIQLSVCPEASQYFFILTAKLLPEMSATTESDGDQSMNLEQLNGAVLTYETADGETVTVEFDE